VQYFGANITHCTIPVASYHLCAHITFSSCTSACCLRQHKQQKLPCVKKSQMQLHCLVDTGRQEGRCFNFGDVSLQDAAAGEVHTLPDGQSITIQGEGQQLAQALLNPSLLGKDLSDLPSATVTQIMQHPDGPTRKVLIPKLDIVDIGHSWCWTLLPGRCGLANSC